MPYRQNFPVPSVIDPPRSCLCIPIPDSAEWRAVVAGLLTELTHWFNYERTGDNSGALCALVWKEIIAEIDWGNMSCCCGEFDLLFQWTVDGILQVSTDDGTSYHDDPQSDPRNSSPVYPPVPGDESGDKMCIAATSIQTLIKEQVGDQLTDDMSRYTLGQLIHDWVTIYIQTSNPFEALIQIITNQILALVIATLRPTLTDEVYAQLVCIFYDNMAGDLSFDDVEWAQVRDDITTQIGGIAGVFLEHLVFLLGKVGLTNLARSQAATEGDCSDCEDCCNDLRNFEPYDADGGIIDPDTLTCNHMEVEAQIRGDGKYYVIVLNNVTDVHFEGFGDKFGTITNGTSAWAQPPEAPGDVVLGLHTGTIPHGDLTMQTVNACLFKSDTPFTATFDSTAC